MYATPADTELQQLLTFAGAQCTIMVQLQKGPYFLGKSFSLVDATLAPWFLREPILEHYRPFFQLPPGTLRLHAWMRVRC